MFRCGVSLGLIDQLAHGCYIEKIEEAVSDGWITARVKSRSLFDKETDGLDINVTTKNAIVMLEGSVSSEIEQDYAVKFD